MNGMDALKRLREQITEVDDKLLPLFERRMEIAGEVAKLKRDNNIPILDEAREQEIIDRALARVGEGDRSETSLLMRTLLALSRGRQRAALSLAEEPLLPPAREPKREGVVCAYQGVPGAWSEHALLRVFPEAERVAEEYFEDVFLAVREERADYGIVPLENSQTGAIGETYDLLRKYNCYIVGRTAVDIRHCLLAPEGTRLGDVAVVHSHPEGFKQCRAFLRGRGWELSGCRNTAVAAELALAAGDGKTAAIGSRRAAKLNGLAVLEPDIMDSAGNRTTFVVVAARPEYDAGCDLVSVSFSTVHRSGALCESLLPFLSWGINLVRIESRPGVAGSYRFFAELEGNIADEGMRSALHQAARASEYFEVIGCYRGY